MSINVDTRRAYTEVVSILNNLSNTDYQKIPENIITVLETNMDNEYVYNINLNKPLDEWKISNKAQVILAVIFRDYLATPRQKDKILNFERTKINELEEEKRRKYNPDNIFQTDVSYEKKEEVVQENVALIEYKENIFKKILNKIFAVFKKNN